jgi:hypothetical protein
MRGFFAKLQALALGSATQIISTGIGSRDPWNYIKHWSLALGLATEIISVKGYFLLISALDLSMDCSGSSGQGSGSAHGFTAAAPWPLTRVGRTGYGAPLVVGFLPTCLGCRGESVLPTLGWWRSVVDAGDDVPSSSSLNDDVWGLQCTSGDGESTQSGGGLWRSSRDSRLASRGTVRWGDDDVWWARVWSIFYETEDRQGIVEDVDSPLICL